MKIHISLPGNQKMFILVLKVFCDFFLLFQICLTHFTRHCPKCLFYINNHKDPPGSVISVERVSRWTEPRGNINKKAQFSFIIPRQGFFPFQTIFTKSLAEKIIILPTSPIYSAKNLSLTALVDILHYTEQDFIALYNQVFYIYTFLYKT